MPRRNSAAVDRAAALTRPRIHAPRQQDREVVGRDDLVAGHLVVEGGVGEDERDRVAGTQAVDVRERRQVGRPVTGDVDQLGLGQLVDDLAGEGELLRQLRPLEFAQVLDEVERVGVDRLDVEEVVLHLPDDVAELGQVAPEDAVAVHAAQVAVDALG